MQLFSSLTLFISHDNYQLPEKPMTVTPAVSGITQLSCPYTLMLGADELDTGLRDDALFVVFVV